MSERNGIRPTRLVWATNNAGKLREIREVMADMPFVTAGYSELAGTWQNILAETAECGSDYSENALIKAWAVFSHINRNIIGIEGVDTDAGVIVAADDSGIEIDYLNGWPGIFSSRFAGEQACDRDRTDKILRMLQDVPFEKRKARFRCSIGVYLPDGPGSYFTVSDAWEGYIALNPTGDSGFGYDPIFFDPIYNMTAAQMESGLKNSISHRGKALRLMKAALDAHYMR